MKRIKLPVKFYTISPEDVEKYENLGIPIPEDYNDGILKVNVDAITAYNEDSKGNTTLYLNNNPEPWMIFLSIKEFEELLND